MKTLLIANRGEIAVRVIRAARELGLRTIAVYSEADRESMHVRMADEAYVLGPASPSESYLNVGRIVTVARAAGADAIHPGYGFLAENAGFARATIDAGFTWVGPNPDAIDAMGDKIRARQVMTAAGVPVVPGGTQPVASIGAAREAAISHGLPLALKASGGGGGKGMKVARTLDELEAAFATARREADAYFHNPTIYAERYLDNPKHVEVQIVADKRGSVIHVGERDCSLQRRHQKLWEETPASIDPGLRTRLHRAAVKAAQAIGYDSVGTMECLVAGNEFFFLEMNTRIQVEHTISEMVSGLDLVREQIRIADGQPLSVRQDDVRPRGHSIEIRINAEDPAQNFRPTPGTIAAYREPGGFGVRVDSAAYAGYTISPDYDSLVAKLIVWAPTRDEARARLRRTIDEFVIEGIPTTLPLLRDLIDAPTVADASYGTATLEEFAREWSTLRTASNGAADDSPAPAQAVASEMIRVEVNDRLFRVRLLDAPAARQRASGPSAPPRPARRSGGTAGAGNAIESPMHGVVVEVMVAAGESVEPGQVVAVIEAMKMMNEIRAHRAGVVEAVHALKGATVEAQTPLVVLQG